MGKNQKYLYPIHQLSETFKGKFLDSMKRALRKIGYLKGFDLAIQTAYKKRWVVHCEPSMADADHVVKYLGQYTHRVAISNDRLLEMSDTRVHFIAKDYRDNAQIKPTSLPGVEFLHRFC